ncbi:LOW QUALITY PROTEIN: talanin-like [Camelus ferus]|uniref:LOW QUALITY PROTEIN: talanin-like n=1 Tax=Camelus ferus TaxID=419612 RepID=A0A8B7K425_CAMFR|nr:LOW QUALITY PROTEIN: talanin-like [Camelus dromedarius]XP_014407214.1 LOW QUALITY PROTEIN: talanin-like [Camelus ferus]
MQREEGRHMATAKSFRCWNIDRNQADINPCPCGANFQLEETIETKATHLKKSLMEESLPWKGHLTFHPLHPIDKKTQAWGWQSGSSSELKPRNQPPPQPTGSNHDMVLRASAEMCCGLSEFITVPSYAGVSIQGHFWFFFSSRLRTRSIQV